MIFLPAYNLKLYAADRGVVPAIEIFAVISQKLNPSSFSNSNFAIPPVKINVFLNEVTIELKKVTWPSRKETSGSTVIVIVVVIVFSLILGIYDFVWAKIITSLLKM